MAVGEKKNTFFISDGYKFIEKKKLEEGTSLNSTNDNVDLHDYHVVKCGENAFIELSYEQTHT